MYKITNDDLIVTFKGWGRAELAHLNQAFPHIIFMAMCCDMIEKEDREALQMLALAFMQMQPKEEQLVH